MSVTYIIGREEIVRVGDGQTVSVGPKLGPSSNARAVIADLVGYPGAYPDLVESFARDLLARETDDLFEVTEGEIDEWAAKIGLKLGKQGVRGL